MSKQKNINILGLSSSHCATACLVQDGKVVGAVSEERFNRQKNWSGYPQVAIESLLKSFGVSGKKLDLVVVNGLAPLAIVPAKKHHSIYQFYDQLAAIFYHFPFLRFFYHPLYKLARPIYTASWREELSLKIQKTLKLKKEKIFYIDHHLGHAWGPLSGLVNEKDRSEKLLILTNDGMGDDYCAAVNIFHQGKLTTVGAKTPNNHSLALVYTAITRYLGMKTLEHEYKVMGLAPYADQAGQKKSYEVLKKLVWLKDNLSFASAIAAPSYYYWLKDHLEGHRFDWIAGAAQQLLEELLVNWVKLAIKKTRLKKIIFGGGIFMNVKANMLIGQLPQVEAVYFMPSATDESTAIGAAYWGYQKICRDCQLPFRPQLLGHLFLGPKYSLVEIRQALAKADADDKYQVRQFENIEKEIAKLLADKKIVARFSGRMEWGSRALGNRSILAHPANPEVVRVINEQIKGRDFWMPFAPTILDERQQEYLVNPKNLKAPFMILAFETTNKAKKELKAAIHPYDFTCRPQVIEKKQNPSYWQIIKEFEKITGIGAVLNTSFNFHGEPIVCSPKDALDTFKNSGLEYLAIEDFLLWKK